MNNIPEYKGYHANIEIDFEGHTLHGHIDNIRDLVTFESYTVEGIIREFHFAVDDYLDFCREVGKLPDRDMHNIEMAAVN